MKRKINKLTFTDREIDILYLIQQKIKKYQHRLYGCYKIEKLKLDFNESENDYDAVNSPGHKIFRIDYGFPMLTLSSDGGIKIDITLDKISDILKRYLNNELDYYKLELILEKFFMTIK